MLRRRVFLQVGWSSMGRLNWCRSGDVYVCVGIKSILERGSIEVNRESLSCLPGGI